MQDTIGEDILDSRNLEERLQELIDDGPGQDLDLIEERKAIREMRDECGGEWKYGIAFIHEDYFEDYARQFAEDIGAIDREFGWPACHIDWEAAADSLKMEYTSIGVLGTTYWFRS